MPNRLSRRTIASYIAHQLLISKQPKDAVTRLAAYLIDTKQTKNIELFIRDIEYELMNSGVVAAHTVSAHQLTAATLTQIESMIKQHTHAATVSLSTLIDPSVIGGVKIDIPGKRLDTTVRRTLHSLVTNNKK